MLKRKELSFKKDYYKRANLHFASRRPKLEISKGNSNVWYW